MLHLLSTGSGSEGQLGAAHLTLPTDGLASKICQVTDLCPIETLLAGCLCMRLCRLRVLWDTSAIAATPAGCGTAQ